MGPILTTLIVIGIIVLAIALGVLFIRHKLSKVTRDYLGMDLKQTSELIKNGLKDEVTTPKSISNVSAMYQPIFIGRKQDLFIKMKTDRKKTNVTQ